MKTVLVADGPAGARELLRVLLEHEGYRVLEAADPEQAVAIARTSLPDLVLLDIELIEPDSFVAVREMRQDRLLKDLAIVAVTDSTRRADREQLLNAGFTGCIAKPVVLRNLREQLNEFAASRQGA